MNEVNQGSSPESDYGRRLAPNIVDEVACREPNRPFVFVPRSRKPEDGWAPVTYQQVANAVNHVAHLLAAKVKRKSSHSFPSVAYVGPSDVRYAIVLLASIKAGCKALFLSPRNSVEGQLSLLDKTDCHHFWHAESYSSIVQPWIRARPMQVEVVPTAEWLESSSQSFPYDRPFEEARWEPFVVLHTSGSTGIPKPIIVRHGSIAIADRLRHLPEYLGTEYMWKAWASRATKMFMPMPLFHAAGLVSALSILVICYGIPIALGMPDQPLSAELTLKSLAHADVDCTMLPPSIVEELTHSRESLDCLKKLKYLIFCGGKYRIWYKMNSTDAAPRESLSRCRRRSFEKWRHHYQCHFVDRVSGTPNACGFELITIEESLPMLSTSSPDQSCGGTSSSTVRRWEQSGAAQTKKKTSSKWFSVARTHVSLATRLRSTRSRNWTSGQRGISTRLTHLCPITGCSMAASTMSLCFQPERSSIPLPSKTPSLDTRL